MPNNETESSPPDAGPTTFDAEDVKTLTDYLAGAPNKAVQRPVDVAQAIAIVQAAGYIVTPRDRPTDRLNLSNVRRVMQEWHDKALSLGYDGVSAMLAEAGAADAKTRPEH